MIATELVPMSFVRPPGSRRLRWTPHLIRGGTEIHRCCIRIRQSLPRRANSVGGLPISVWQPDVALSDGQTYHFEGWTIMPTRERITFTNDATSHGMAMERDYSVKPF